MNMLRLNVGCGHGRVEGFVNCDLYPGPNVDEAFDCQEKWPFPDDAAQDVVASHVLEHLSDPRAFFRECWRVLIPNGSLAIRVPYGGHRAAWWDLEHKRPWYAESFAFVQPGYAQAIGNPEHDGWSAYFSVEYVDFRLSPQLARFLRYRWQRKLLVQWINAVPDWCEELFIYLYALKTPEAVAEWQRTRAGQVLPARYVAYRHHLRGRPRREGEPMELIPLADLDAINGYI